MIKLSISKALSIGLALLILASSTQAALKKGDKAPDFDLKSLQNKRYSLSQLSANGHVMLIFWEPECVYCYMHIKDFKRFHHQYKSKGLTVTAINFLGETDAAIQEYVDNNNIDYLVLSDQLKNIDVAAEYQVIGTPTIVLISPQKKILYYGHKLPDLDLWIK